MVVSAVSTSTLTTLTVVTISLSTPTGSSADVSPKSSSNNNDLPVGLASAGGFALLLTVIGLLFCLKNTRTKHRRRIEDMERRLNGLENQTRPPPARRTKRFSTATGTSLGSSWGAWRSRDAKNFGKLRTANQTSKGENRKSFGHGWWSFSPAPINRDQHQNVTPLQDITLPRSANPRRTIDTSENDIDPLMAPRLSAMVECSSPSPAPAPPPPPAPARPISPTMKTPYPGSTATQPHTSGLFDDKEIDITSERVRNPCRKYDRSSMSKEVAVGMETGLSKVCNNFYFKSSFFMAGR